MSTDHLRRAAVMYPNRAAKAEPVRAPPTNGGAAAGEILYGRSKPGEYGSVANAIASTFGREASWYADDTEKPHAALHAP
jgi:hypothetical protein